MVESWQFNFRFFYWISRGAMFLRCHPTRTPKKDLSSSSFIRPVSSTPPRVAELHSGSPWGPWSRVWPPTSWSFRSSEKFCFRELSFPFPDLRMFFSREIQRTSKSLVTKWANLFLIKIAAEFQSFQF